MTASSQFAVTRNGVAIDRAAIPLLAFDEFRQAVLSQVAQGLRVASLFGYMPVPDQAVELLTVLADDSQGRLQITSTRLSPPLAPPEGDGFQSLTPQCPQVHLFEREIAEQFGIKPIGHPWLKPVRFHPSYRRGHDAWNRKTDEIPTVGVMDYYKVEGEEIHEVAVGPVHAGVIEPGHFRFQCHGEHVFHLEISLGYAHRGVERALISGSGSGGGGPDKRTIHYMETAAGDTTIGHATAYSHIIEALTRRHSPPRANVLRAIMLELERLANHVGDLGALSGDVGYLPTAAYCGRLRGDYLNMTALVCGSRFGRGMVRPGGAQFDLESDRTDELLTRLDAAETDTAGAVNLLWDSYSVMARLEDVGAVSQHDCEELGLVGPAARASGIGRDVRHDHPAGHFRFSHIPVSTWNSGDVFARAYVRWLEIQRSIAFVREQLQALPKGSHRTAIKAPLAPGKCVASLVEGWRGEICHVALTDEQGRFTRYKMTDPSFHNWHGLAMALRDQQISDFPLCNKSFNLSYCGHDL
ncbi:MAG: NADH-quinone oxidoreductase subunit C [Phycisphaerales bacterium]|nr:NADH-quinone oxidoreductase subunit C [Phycisphaerales bacterium]